MSPAQGQQQLDPSGVLRRPPALQQLQRPSQPPHRLVRRELVHGPSPRPEPVLDGLVHLDGHDGSGEVVSELGEVIVELGAVHRLEGAADRVVQPRPADAGQVVVERGLDRRVREAEAEPRRFDHQAGARRLLKGIAELFLEEVAGRQQDVVVELEADHRRDVRHS